MRSLLSVSFLVAITLPSIPVHHSQPHHATVAASKPADVALVVKELIDTTNELNATKADNAAKDAAIAQKDRRIAALEASSSGVGGRIVSTYSGNGSFPNHFAYGYCTWYVATRRYIPWIGNANQWFAGAQAYGYATGATPRVGAVMVTSDGWPWNQYGHVAYVESVSPLVVSEMNFNGWGVVDFRWVLSTATLIGFVY